MSVWYLDLDDEITDAVARLRAAKDDKLVLVLPPGSRIGTGRINFRLLAREAESRGLTVALVSSDPQVRALGASAGLTAHATVADAERALGLEVDDEGTGTRSTASIPSAARVATAVSTTSDPAADDASADVGKHRRGGLLHRRREGYAVTPRTATAAAAEGTGAVTIVPYAPGDGARIVRRGPTTRRRVATWGVRGAIVGALAAGALYVAYLTLPTATVTLIPGTSTLGPQAVPIVASPNTPVVDVATGTIPAEWYKIPLNKSGTFDASGRDEVTTFARGKVQFTSKNTLTEMVIPEGTKVSTVDGRDYRTLAQVTLPVWDGDGPKPRAEVDIQATRRGKDGNAGPEAISTIKGGIGRLGISVTNLERIEGGDRYFRNVVTGKDCQAATQELVKELEADLAVAAAGDATPGLKRFASSATIGTPVITPACADLVDQAVDTFELKAETTGTVLEVDESVLEPTAEQHFQLGLDPALQLEPGSVVASREGEPVVESDKVTFPMAVTALVTRPWDAARIKTEIAGKPVSEAKRLLSAYGEATLVMWPDFVPNVPTDAGRISLDIPTTAQQ